METTLLPDRFATIDMVSHRFATLRETNESPVTDWNNECAYMADGVDYVRSQNTRCGVHTYDIMTTATPADMTTVCQACEQNAYHVLALTLPATTPACIPYGDTPQSDIERFDARSRAARAVRIWERDGNLDAGPIVSVADLLTLWHAHHEAYETDVRTVARRLRAAARAHGWQHHYDDTMTDVIDNLRSPFWRATVARPTEMRLGTTHDVRPQHEVPPIDVYDIAHNVSALDMVRAIGRTQRDHAHDFATLAEALVECARDNGWCGEYERLVDELNEMVSEYAATPFLARDREYAVSIDVTFTVVTSHTVIVRAADEDSATDEAYNLVDYSDAEYALERAAYVSYVSHSDTEVSDVSES